MKKIKFKRFIAAAIAMVLSALAVPMAPAEAKGEVWTHPGNGWHYLEGTDISVQIEGTTIRIKGTGAIPDYDTWTLHERPWGNTNCQAVFIDDTITSIGKYAFYNMSELRYITMSTKTFIADASTSFGKIAYKPIYRLIGEEETVKMFGTIPFTSYDSIKRLAQANSNGASYILDTAAAARKFQTSTSPSIANVYNATDGKAPWNNLEENWNGAKLDPAITCKITTPGTSSSYGVSTQRIYPGDACYEAYAAFIGDYKFATTFNITLMSGGKKIYRTDNALNYTLAIPPIHRYPGRVFKLLAIGEGVVNIYDDLDKSDATITFSTDTPTTAYALVYQ